MNNSFHGAKLILFAGPHLVALRRDHSPGIPWPGYLDFPGGGREGDESAQDCVLRETYEELGLRLRPQDLQQIHIRVSDHGRSYFFATDQPAQIAQQIRFGGEGASWQLMDPQSFVNAPDAIPHFRQILQDYLLEKGAGTGGRTCPG
jgi:8-oxo-dGTP diphosphatase